MTARDVAHWFAPGVLPGGDPLERQMGHHEHVALGQIAASGSFAENPQQRSHRLLDEAPTRSCNSNRTFPPLGARVVAVDLAAETGQKIATEAGAHFVTCDVPDPDSVGDAFAKAVDHLDGLDVLIHAAGIAPGGPAEEITLDGWQKIMAVNATGTFLTNLAAFEHLEENGGRVINFASTAGVQGCPGKAAYAASKGAVVAWLRSVAVEWGRHGVTVNAIAPAIWTPMYDRTRTSMTPDQLAAHAAQMAQSIPLGGRLGDVQRDLVPVLSFLSGEGAGFMTGQVFPVDGGTLMMR